MLDEPVVGLDPPSQALLVELLLDAKASGTAVLLTTHQMAFADGVADRAIVLGEGEVLDQGPWAEVRKRAAERGWLPGRCLSASPSPADGGRTRVRDIRRFWHVVQAPPSLLKRLEPAYYVFITLAIGGPFVYGTASAALSEVATPRAVGDLGAVARARRVCWR